MTVKTAISLNDSLFAKVEDLTRELDISRSRLFAIAVQEFIERHETRRMFAALNEVYEDGPDEEDKAIQRGIQEYHRKLMKDERW